MKKSNSRIKSVLFGILLTAVTAAYAFWLEISKNTLLGWVILAALVVAFLGFRIFFKKRDRWNMQKALLFWGFYVLLLALNLKLTEPPFRPVPAVDGKNGGVTGVISIPQGDLAGVLTSDRAVEVYAGIPYAAPPVGDLRFREPADPEPWEGVLSCDTFAPMAMQQSKDVWYNSLTEILGTHNYRFSIFDNYREPMSEDCLYLNIWKPAGAQEEPLPVLFYIHGGSLTTGQSYDDTFRGETFAKQGVIVVTPAYRLGVFGYFADEELETESDHGTTGDYGLLDQIAALKWVNENIGYFGGDPGRITIAGESAGSSSVNAVCVSPLSEGLFQYAIGESSGIAAKHPYHTFREKEEALETGQKVMEEMGASDIAELRTVPAEKLVQTSLRNDSMMVDGYAIAEQPYLTYERGGNHEKALLNGFNGKEADAFLLDTKATSENYIELLQEISGDYAEELAGLVPPGSVTRDQAFITDKGGDAKGALNYVYSAAWFTFSHHIWSGYLVKQGKPVYEYYFTKENNGLSDFHAGEIPYAYGNLDRIPAKYEAPDHELSEKMQSYWINFIRTGNPNGRSITGTELPAWEARNATDELLLELNETPSMIRDPYRDIYVVLEKYMESL